MLDEAMVDEPALEHRIFDKKKAEVLFPIAGDGHEAGFALFFHNLSTFLDTSGIYLEDPHVKPECRICGYGKTLVKKLAAITVERGCGRPER